MKKPHLYVLVLAGAALFGHTASQASLIAYYPFDNNADDASGNGNHGVASGDAALSGGPGFNGSGSAFSFSGAGHVVSPVNINPSVIPDLTVTMWVRADQAIVGTPGLYKTFGHDDGGWDRTFGLDNRNGDYRWAAFTGGAGPGPTNPTATPVSGDWVFLAAVWDTDGAGVGAHTVTFYANGESVTQALTNTPSGHTTAAIGNLRPDNFNEGWQGLIDDVRIYDTALTPSEVAAVRAIPEPGSALLIALGATGLMRRRRRRS